MVASHARLAKLRALPLSREVARLAKMSARGARLSTDLHVPVDTMTDCRRYRDSAATPPPSESRGDIRYLLCLPEIVPRILDPTPAFRGSFRFQHYPLTGAAESS